MKLKSLLLSTLLAGAFAQNPITNCNTGLGLQRGNGASSGACQITTGIDAMSANAAIYNGGAGCGKCFQFTGPKGTHIAMVVDICQGADSGCDVSTPVFSLSSDAFSALIDGGYASASKLNDLSYQEVTCGTSGSITATVGSSPTSSYFNVKFENAISSISSVSISYGSTSKDLTRQGQSAVWEFNQPNEKPLTFPATITLTPATKKPVSFTAQNTGSLFTTSTINTGVQFDNTNPVAGSTCAVASAPNAIYLDGLASGWVTGSNIDSTADLSFTSNTYLSSTYSIDVKLTGGSGYDLQFTRDGGVDTRYFSVLTFAARAANNGYSIKVFLDTNTSTVQTFTISSSWSLYNYSLTSAPDTFKTIHFAYNSNDSQQEFFFDNIVFVNASVTPASNVANIFVTTGAVQFVTTGNNAQYDAPTTTTTNGGSTTTSTSSSSIVAVSSLFAFASLLALLA